jgi:hypothetical protein
MGYRRPTSPSWRRFTGGWQRPRRQLRMTKECGTLPSATSRVNLFNGGAREAVIATAVLVSVFLYIAGMRVKPRL